MSFPSTKVLIRVCNYCRAYSRESRKSRRDTHFPHGFSATEPLVPPSTDGSTPLTDALPRSALLDPTTYQSKLNFRHPPPSKDPGTQLTELEKRILENPLGILPRWYCLIFSSKNTCITSPNRQNSKQCSTSRYKFSLY